MTNRLLILMALSTGVCSLWTCSIPSDQAPAGIKHVVVIGFDGLSPNGIIGADTPNFDRLIREGAHTFHDRAVLPSSSSSNWASMIMGAGTEQHGITSNDWERDRFTLPTVAQGEQFLFPTIFRLIDEQIPEAEIGAIYHWEGFGRLFEKSAVDYDIHGNTEEETASLAVRYLKEKKPTFTFVHFDHVDHAGHEFGHGTPEYYKAVEKADRLLGELVKAITDAGIKDETLVILSADHGGVGKGHGGATLKEMEIPFILWGTSVKKGYEIKYPVYQFDNASTVAFALGIKQPFAWIGKPARMAFAGFSVEDKYPLAEYWKDPVILSSQDVESGVGGLYVDSAQVRLANPNEKGRIKYTLDGTAPTKGSKTYTNSFYIHENHVLRAAIFENDSIKSSIAEGYLRIRDKAQKPPVSYEVYYLNELKAVPELINYSPDLKGSCFEITSAELGNVIKENTAVHFKATITADQSGNFKFYTRSDDGSKLWIDGEAVVDNDGDHGIVEKSGAINLIAGQHALEVTWFNGGGSGWLEVYFEDPDGVKQILSTTNLN